MSTTGPIANAVTGLLPPNGPTMFPVMVAMLPEFDQLPVSVSKVHSLGVEEQMPSPNTLPLSVTGKPGLSEMVSVFPLSEIPLSPPEQLKPVSVNVATPGAAGLVATVA